MATIMCLSETYWFKDENQWMYRHQHVLRDDWFDRAWAFVQHPVQELMRHVNMIVMPGEQMDSCSTGITNAAGNEGIMNYEVFIKILAKNRSHTRLPRSSLGTRHQITPLCDYRNRIFLL